MEFITGSLRFLISRCGSPSPIVTSVLGRPIPDSRSIRIVVPVRS